MACATLKRSGDWDALNQRATKRRRCNPFGQVSGGVLPSCSTGCVAVNSDETIISHTNIANRRCIEKTERGLFIDVASKSKMSQDEFTENIRGEIKRLHKPKQSEFSSIERMQDSESSGSEMGSDSHHHTDFSCNSIRSSDITLFTFKQVRMICKRMLKERGDAIREEYDTVLTTKLAEQYDAFVKFTCDQIQKRHEAVPSYLS